MFLSRYKTVMMTAGVSGRQPWKSPRSEDRGL